MKNLIILFLLFLGAGLNAQSIDTYHVGESELGILDILEVNEDFYVIRNGQMSGRNRQCAIIHWSFSEECQKYQMDCRVSLTQDEEMYVLNFIESNIQYFQ